MHDLTSPNAFFCASLLSGDWNSRVGLGTSVRTEMRKPFFEQTVFVGLSSAKPCPLPPPATESFSTRECRMLSHEADSNASGINVRMCQAAGVYWSTRQNATRTSAPQYLLSQGALATDFVDFY